MCVPRLLDGLHPFIALTLLLSPQLQRLLSIVTKHEKEVVLKRERWRGKKSLFLWPWDQTHPQHHSSVVPTLSLYSTRCFGCSFEMLATANKTYGTNICTVFAFHALFLPRFTPYKVPQTIREASRARRQREWDEMGEGGWLDTDDMSYSLTEIKHRVSSVTLFSTGLLSSPSIRLPLSLSLPFPVCLSYYSDEFSWVSAFQNASPHLHTDTPTHASTKAHTYSRAHTHTHQALCEVIEAFIQMVMSWGTGLPEELYS